MKPSGNLSFNELHSSVQRALIRKGFVSLRPIQEKCIKPILQHKNVLIIAPTASGKTEAVMLPVFTSILNSDYTIDSVKCIYVAPLKALLNDLELRLNQLRENNDAPPYIFKWHGDVPHSKKLRALKNIPDILLITPESLEVLFLSPYVDLKKLFSKLDIIVIDEIHNLAADSRGAQLISIIERLQNITKTPIQRIGLSATIGNSGDILNWMCSSSFSKREIIKDIETPKNHNINFLHLDEEYDESCDRYFQFLNEFCIKGKTIIFNNSKNRAECVAADLENLGINCFVHHGSLSKYVREEAEEEIRRNKRNAVISATSTLELGIDIGDLDRVIQFDKFPSVNSFLQRMGRSGRRIDKVPILASLTKYYDDFLINLAIISLALVDGYSEPLRPSTLRYDILLQQLLSEAVGNFGINKNVFWNKVHVASSFLSIEFSVYEELLAYWTDLCLIRIDQGDILIGIKGEKIFGFKNYIELFSVFESKDQFEVIFDNSQIGVLDPMFVIPKPVVLFRLAGKKWRIREIDFQRKIIYVTPAESGRPPFWISASNFTVEYEVAQRIREILKGEKDCKYVNANSIESKVIDYLRKGYEYEIISKEEIKISIRDEFVSVSTYGGSMINRALGIWLSSFSNSEPLGIDHTDIVFEIKKVKSDRLKEILINLKSDLINNRQYVEEQFYKVIFEKIQTWEFSKFSYYLPEHLRKKYLISSYFRFNEVFDFLLKSKIS